MNGIKPKIIHSQSLPESLSRRISSERFGIVVANKYTRTYKNPMYLGIKKANSNNNNAMQIIKWISQTDQKPALLDRPLKLKAWLQKTLNMPESFYGFNSSILYSKHYWPFPFNSKPRDVVWIHLCTLLIAPRNWHNGVCSFPPINRPINLAPVYWGFRELSITY